MRKLAGRLYFAREKTLVERRGGRVRQGDQLAYGKFFLGEWGGRLRIDDGEHVAGAHSAQQQTVGLDTDDSIFFVEDEFFSHMTWMPSIIVAMPAEEKLPKRERHLISAQGFEAGAIKSLPHSRQAACARGVMRPQAGHILWEA